MANITRQHVESFLVAERDSVSPATRNQICHSLQAFWSTSISARRRAVLFVSSAMDGVGDYLQDLAFANDIGLYWSETPDDLVSARPVGDLSLTE